MMPVSILNADCTPDILGVTEDRLRAVCIRLQQMDVPVEQIAFSLGFKDPGYFNRFFKKYVGIPPGTYRRRAKSQRASGASSYAAWP